MAKSIVCLLGIAIIIGSLILMAQTETITKQAENPDYHGWMVKEAWRETAESYGEEEWNKLAEAHGYPTWSEVHSPNPKPPQYITEYEYFHPYTTLGAVVFLIGFVALVIGFAIPER